MPVLLTIVSTSITLSPTNDAHFSSLISAAATAPLMSSVSENGADESYALYNLCRSRLTLAI